MIAEILSKRLDYSMMELHILQQDVDKMLVALEKEEDPLTVSRKSIEPSVRLRQPREELEDEASLQFISDKISDVIGRIVR